MGEKDKFRKPNRQEIESIKKQQQYGGKTSTHKTPYCAVRDDRNIYLTEFYLYLSYQFYHQLRNERFYKN